jgi:hypothetical protein
MCEYVSVVATTEGPLHLYAAPGLKSHGDARAGWKFTGGAEVEWTGENHDSLVVRHEDDATARTVKAMLIERFPNRTAIIASITETRGADGYVVFYRDGVRRFTESEAGSNADVLNELLMKLPTFPYFRPTPECSDVILEQLVAEHLYLLGTRCKDPHQFDGVALKIVRDPAAWAAARAAAKDAAWAAAWDDAWDAARDAAWAAARDAARDAAHLVSGLPNNPWASLVEMWALGAMPIGVVDEEFVVYVAEVPR